MPPAVAAAAITAAVTVGTTAYTTTESRRQARIGRDTQRNEQKKVEAAANEQEIQNQSQKEQEALRLRAGIAGAAKGAPSSGGTILTSPTGITDSVPQTSGGKQLLGV